MPADEAGRLWAHQLQLTIADFVAEIHDTHHPVGSSLYYEEQKTEALRRSEEFRGHRLPKYLRYFEEVITRNPRGNDFLIGDSPGYIDLSLFQVMTGLRYAFPAAMAGSENDYPLITALRGRIEALPNIRTYLDSDRRLAFSEDGLFRHYPELDGDRG